MATAYGYLRHGGPEAEAFLDLEPAAPGPGELLVKVRAAGVNPVDFKLRNGRLPSGAAPGAPPTVFGREIAGVVAQVGDGVRGFAVGDAVFGNPASGGYAEYTLVSQDIAAHKPQGVSFVDASALPVAGATAYDGLQQLGLPAGATLLVIGAGGGVGVAATQIARHRGIKVIGTAGADKKEFVESLGAVHVPYGPGVMERVAKAAGADGVDAVFDLVGGAELTAAAALPVSPEGRLISAAAREQVVEAGGAPVRRTRTVAVLEEVGRLAAEGVLRPQVTRTFPLAQASQALRAVEDGHAKGKIVIEVGA